MANYAEKVRLDIERWVASGLVDRATGDRLAIEIVKTAPRAFTFGSVLAAMAAILLGASVLVFIAANWEAIPRIVRVLALFALIFGSYVGGALLKERGSGFGEALYLLGAVAFGGSIALIGQMYHLSGDETEAILVWCIGTAVAAAGLRSPMLTNAAVLLAITWLLMRTGDWGRSAGFPYFYLVLAAALWAISYWTRSMAARHILLLSISLYAVLFGFSFVFSDDFATFGVVGAALAILATIVFFAAHNFPEDVERYAQLGGPAPAHSLIAFVVGIAMVQVKVYDQFGLMLLATLVAFAGIVTALLLRGRQSALMRWIAYAAFTVELAFLYFVTLGALIDTAALFLFSGLALAGVAFFIMRLERRFGTRPVEGAAS
ncbi:MAG TPA: DUF2157 domain-containing protein [Mesorhizobium sp.]|jgi:uncharacterized membrane protein